ncbi:MAG TPA: UvrD-helicase domain-containing protein [Opitutales bacterium]|nr:UvrD-helicase domain-containing protein [Opitutales bacterium]
MSADQLARERFDRETEKNFSVIAPAGVGKTTAISRRVAQIARGDAGARAEGREPRLPRLVVATYTRKAAEELRNRARAEIVKAALPPAVFGYFNEAYFGTIHSFCLELLRRFGPLAGLSARLAIEPEDTAPRLAFQRDTADTASFLPVAARANWRRYGAADVIWPLVWKWPAGSPPPPAPGPFPQLDFSAVLDFAPKRKDGRVLRNLEISRERLRRWREAGASARALGVPEVSGGGEEFKARWNQAFQPLREWLAAAAAHAAAGLAEAFALAKLSRGTLGYDDLARAALRLLRDPAAGAAIRAQGYSVILDEAQDTDPAQFAVLLGVAQPPGATGLWTEGAEPPPAPGRFSMVGDPQQSIYTRADVKLYLDLHEKLQRAHAAEALTFSVTHRCDEAVVHHVNERFAEILSRARGQVGFVELRARPDAGRGRVWRLPVTRPADFPAKPKVAEMIAAEARALAQWLSQVGYAGVGASGWEHVAILAPRRDWLEAVALELQSARLDAQLHSSDRTPGADPARAWLGALLGVLADPGDIFETIGVLREIFGVSDDALYHWRTGAPLSNDLGAALALLAALAREVAEQPLRDAAVLAAQAVRLRERLAALPAPSDPEALETLLDQATLADARGETLAAFARALRRGPAEAVEDAARLGVVQLLTNHKAKGLEWQAVIQFGLFLEPRFPAPEYPCWRPAAPDQLPRVFYDGVHAALENDGENALALARRAEFERLLYVAATRPRHTLILLDAESLGEKTSAKSLAALMGMVEDGPARATWKNLAAPGEKNSGKKSPNRPTVSAPESIRWPQPEWPEGFFAAALPQTTAFTRRVRPSTLARHTDGPQRDEPDLAAPPDYPEEQPAPTAAVAYGNWWHELMEDTPWSRGRAAWEEFWHARIATAPEPERADAEIALLRHSALAERLAAPDLEFCTEAPFLWTEPGGVRAFDGCVDLAVWDGKNSRWLVVDWKTDRTGRDAAGELRQRYGPQVEIYARALAAISDTPAEAFLYGTREGALIAL